MIKLAVVDSDPQFADEIGHLLEQRADMVVMATALDLNQALAIAEKQQPQVMLIGPGIGTDISAAFVKKLTAHYPIGCILLAYNATNKLRTAAMRANIVEVIQVPVDPGKIIAVIKTAAGYAEQLAVRGEEVVEEHKCTVITIFSTKGGVGKTVLSTNIATSLASMADARVILIDLDLQFGDVGIAMGLSPDKTMLDFTDSMLNADFREIDELLVTHKSGVRVLMAPKGPESADLIDGGRVSTTLSILKKHADFIIIDTTASFNDTVLAALDKSDEICIVLTMDMLSVKNIKLCLRTLNDLKYVREMQKIVINRVENNVGLKVGEIERVLGMNALAKIPADKAVSLSINKGVPVVIDAPKNQVSKEIEELAHFYVSKYRRDWIEIKMSS